MVEVYGGNQKPSHNVVEQAKCCCGFKNDNVDASTDNVQLITEGEFIEKLSASKLTGRSKIMKAVAFWIVCYNKTICGTNQKLFVETYFGKPKKSATYFSSLLHPRTTKGTPLFSNIYDYKNWDIENCDCKNKSTRDTYIDLQILCRRAETIVKDILKDYNVV